MSNDTMGDRFKHYEDVNRHYLTPKMPMILRLDGKAFHTYTRKLEKPYSLPLHEAMNSVAAVLCQSVQNTALAYVQSDEISLLLIDYRDIKTDAWFDGNLQKIVSVSASIAGAEMTSRSFGLFGELRPAAFDCRAFVLPQDEVNNYFIWRQQDWIRNSIQMLAQSLYSQKELQNKNTGMLHEMCYQKGFNWADQSSHIKNGRVVIQRQVPKEVVNKKTGEKLTVTRNKWYVPEDTPRFFGDDTFINGKVKL